MARSKASDDLDLTPFIGLFAMLVVLLLLTASWSKIYSFKTKFSTSQNAAAPIDNPEDKDKEVSLSIKALQDKLVLIEKGEETKKYQLDVGDDFEIQKLEEVISDWKDSFGDEKQITIESEAEYKYGKMISLYDKINGLGMKKIAISTANIEEI